MYTTEIITLLTWPLLIAVSYFVITKLIKNFEAKEEIKNQN